MSRPDTSRARPPSRVFLGLTEIAGFYSALRSGFGEIGISADVMTVRPYSYADDTTQSQSADAIEMTRWVRRTIRDDGWVGLRLLRELLVRVRLLVWATRRYDCFVFGFRNTFLVGWDLPILRLLGKRIVCVFHGSDSRPAYVDRQNGAGRDARAKARWVRRRKRVIRRLERWSHEVVVGGLTTQLHGRPVVLFQALGVPVTASAVRPPLRGGAIRVVHAPSDLATKGTQAIRAAVATLRDDGFDVDYVELSGVPNTVVRAELAQADLVIDQLYSDTLLGGLGAEAASAGCAAVVGGYELDVLRAQLKPDMVPPAVYCEPAELLEVLRRVLADRDAIAALGADAQCFIAERWSPSAVADRYRRLLVGDVPQEWRLDPSRCVAVAGCGVDRETAVAWCCDVGRACGASGLGVDDKPELRAAYLASCQAG